MGKELPRTADRVPERNFEAMDPLEWLAGMSDHIPDPGEHCTLFYGEVRETASGLSLPRPKSAWPRSRKRCSSYHRQWPSTKNQP